MSFFVARTLLRAGAPAAMRRAFSMPAYSATKPGGGAVVRPLSPHLGIYTFKGNMLTSIVFRGAGILMFGGVAGLAATALLAKHKFPFYVYHLQQMPLLNALVKFGVAFPLTYHALGGLRHIAWDHLMWHDPVSTKTSGVAILGIAAAVGLVAVFVEGSPSSD